MTAFSLCLSANRPALSARAFTLVEMLVVIAVIAILAAMLMPALQKAIEQARSANCQNNCKQIGLASASYMNDFNGYFPCTSYSNAVGLTYPNGWSVTPFGNQYKVLGIVWVSGYLPPLQTGTTPPLSSPAICPSLYPDWCKVNWSAATGGYIGNHLYIRGGTYGFNDHLDRSLQSVNQTIRPNLRKFTSLKNLGSRFVFTDSTEQRLRIVIARREDFVGQSSEGYEPNWIHNNATNFLFGDGHAQSFQRDALPEVTTATGWPSSYALGSEGVMPVPW